jgi:hypothetical protein
MGEHPVRSAALSGRRQLIGRMVGDQQSDWEAVVLNRQPGLGVSGPRAVLADPAGGWSGPVGNPADAGDHAGTQGR